MHSLTQTKTILVDGATGYIGGHLVNYLTKNLEDKKKIRCLARNKSSDQDINVLRNYGADLYLGDLDQNGLDKVFSKVDIACHLIGSIAPRRGETSSSLHVEQTTRFVQLCLQNGVKKIVMVSACGADPEALSEYHRTKWQAEQIILSSGIPSIVLRPSLVIGKTTGVRNSKLLNRLESLIRNKKSVPLIAGGHNKIQPIFIEDLTLAISKSLDLEDHEIPLELGGPQVTSLREFVELMMLKMQKQKSILDLPVPIALLAAHIAKLTQAVPIISPDQVKISQVDNVCEKNYLQSLIGKEPTTIESSLDSYHW